MNNRKLIVPAIAGAALIVASQSGPEAPIAADTAPAKSQGKLPQPIVDTHHLMELFNQPLYEYLKKAMENQPQDDEGWSTIEDRGLQTAEVMNLVAIRQQAEEHARDWEEHVRGGQQAGLRLAEVAKTKKWSETLAAYRNVIKNCNDCHQQFGGDHAPRLEP